MNGLKAKAKKYLKSKGIKTIRLDNSALLKLQNAKTSDVVKVAIKNGF